MLYEHPMNQGTLTPEALKLLIQSYRELENAGCRMVLVEVSLLFGSIQKKRLKGVWECHWLFQKIQKRLKATYDLLS